MARGIEWLLVIVGGASASRGRSAGDREVDKAFFVVESIDMEWDAHAHSDDFAVGGDPCAAVGFEEPTSLWESFAFDNATDAHVWDFDHEAHGADIGDEAVEDVRSVLVCEALEVFEEFDLFGFGFGVGRGAFGF